MRTALLSAVRYVLRDGRLKGRSDLVKLTAVVSLAKAPAESVGVKMPYRDLGGWVGCSVSHVGHTLVPELKSTSALRCRPKRDADGRVEALLLELLFLREARASEVANPLSVLSKVDLATLLYFVEAVTCPGWAPRGKEPTPAGFMAWRRGLSASSDRLAMVLLSLEARPDGRVRMSSGRVPGNFRRADATLAKLLGCSLKAAAAVVNRLDEAGAVELEREDVPGRDRLRVPAIAAAHARVKAAATVEECPVEEAPQTEIPPVLTREQVPGEGPEEMVLSGDGWEQESLEDALEAAESCAFRDQQNVETPNVQVRAGSEAVFEGSFGAGLHAAHAPLADLSGVGAGSLDGFSGSAVLGEGRLRERACAGEDLADSDGSGLPGSFPAGERSPLRGDKPKQSPARKQKLGASAAFVRSAAVPDDLVIPLAPVAGLWSGITKESTARWLADAVRAELKRTAAVVGPEFAERALAQRLERRLREQLRVRDLVGWLLHRGLPQRARCWSLECDDGVRMNTGWACESCDCRVADRRAQRSAVSLEVASEFAMASKSVRRAEVEQRLQQVVQAQAAAESVRHERAARERVQRAAAWAAQRAEWETETAERNARACGKCGEPNASGQCPACAFAERTEVWIREAVDIVVALQADPLDLAGVRALSQRVEADSWAVIEQARQLGPETYVGMRAQELRQLAEALFRQRKRAALRRLSTHALAEAEGESAYRRVMEDRLWKFRTRHEAENAAALARTKAQARVAQELLDEFLADLSRARANMTFPAAVAPWSERLAVLAQADE